MDGTYSQLSVFIALEQKWSSLTQRENLNLAEVSQEESVSRVIKNINTVKFIPEE